MLYQGSLRQKVYRSLVQDCGVKKGDTLVVGYSAGPDSTALLHLLMNFSSKMELDVIAAHLNHGIRGSESDADERMARKVCDRWNIPLETDSLPQGNLKSEDESLEEVARRERLQFLRKIRKKYGASAIALGHHKKDQAETVLLALVRGAGSSGIAGILPRRGPFIHPMLRVSKDEILDYIERHQLRYRIDASNEDVEFRRNRVRLELMPYLRDNFNPAVESVLAQTSEIIRAEDRLLERQTGDAFRQIAGVRGFSAPKQPGGKRVFFNRKEFLKQPEAIQRRLVRLSYALLSGDKKELGFSNVEQVRRMVNTEGTGKQLHLPRSVTVRVHYDRFSMQESGGVSQLKPCILTVPGRVVLSNGVIVGARLLSKEQTRFVKKALLKHRRTLLVSHTFIDYNKVDLPLVIRARIAGDRMQPLGMNGQKKIKDVLIDEKIPLHIREHIPLVVCNNEVMWLAGVRVSEKYRVDNNTCRAVHLFLRGFNRNDVSRGPNE